MSEQIKNREIAHLQERLDHLERKTEEWQSQISKINRLESAIQRLDETQTYLRQELERKHAEVSGRVNEWRNTGARIQGLVEKHDMAVGTLSTQAQSARKKIIEQGILLDKIETHLEEAKKELFNLKSPSGV